MGLVGGIGIQFGVLVSFGAFAGQQLDDKLASSWFMPLGVGLGSLAAFVNMLWILKYLERTLSKNKESSDGTQQDRQEQRDDGNRN